MKTRLRISMSLLVTISIACPGIKLFSQNADIPLALWQIQNHTPATHLVLIPKEVIKNMDLQEGDYIGAFTTEGLCAGTVKIESGDKNMCLTVYGDDMDTLLKDGFFDGEPMLVRLFQTKSSDERDLFIGFDPTFPNQGIFTSHGISALKAEILSIGSVENTSNLDFSLYPNPARAEVTISWNSEKPEQTLLLIYNAFGQLVKEIKIAPSHAGKQQLLLDVSHLGQGTYSVNLKTFCKSGVKKLILVI